MLRQDPDIILIGEIRDKETAEIAVQASLTGHLVFSTLHTNDAPSAIARLLDLGLEPFLVTATLEGIVAQRLVRKICNNCRAEYTPSEEQLMELELRPDDVAGKTFYYGKGCEQCNNTGDIGRQGIYEMMVLDDDMRDLIVKHASTCQVLRLEAKKARAYAPSTKAACWPSTTASAASEKSSAKRSWTRDDREARPDRIACISPSPSQGRGLG